MCIATASRSYGQESIRTTVSQPAAWVNYTGIHPVSDKWRVLAELQFRQYDAGRQPMQRFVRTGLLRVVTPGVRMGGGYLFAHTSPPEDFVPVVVRFSEHRLWQQFDMNANTGKFSWNHRYRLEQRWTQRLGASGADSAQHLGWNYSNRMRYMARVVRAPGGGPPKNGKLYLAAYNELFMSFGRNVRFNVFDQNRAFVGLGKQWSPKFRAELGYMNQLVLRANGTDMERNHTVMLAFASDAAWFGGR
ncbi:MAG: DUF2490 domain-containing protein [Phycisphaerae bacterium]|nr:DUF2490 domain-containing protein [Gemmatimonadaceae bacterium]